MSTFINATSGIPQYSPSTPASFGFDAFGRTKVAQPYTLLTINIDILLEMNLAT